MAGRQRDIALHVHLRLFDLAQISCGRGKRRGIGFIGVAGLSGTLLILLDGGHRAVAGAHLAMIVSNCHALPAGGFIACGIPADKRGGDAGVIILAVEEVRGGDSGLVSGLPGIVGCDGLPRAVGIGDDQLAPERQFRLAVISHGGRIGQNALKAGHKSEVCSDHTSIPAGPDFRRKRHAVPADEIRHIVSLIVHIGVVVGPAGRKNVLALPCADLLTIDVWFIDAQRSHVQDRGHHVGAVELTFRAQQGCALGLLLAGYRPGLCRNDPCGRICVRVGDKTLLCTVGYSSGAVCDGNSPGIDGVFFQRIPNVGNRG